jgi:DNA-binding transcriptional LysR family regulator
MAGRDVSLDLLRTFQAVYRAGAVTAAARLLRLTQPTVTAQLRALETAVGQPLFVRQARGVRPTAAGDDLAHRLDGPLDALADIAADLARTPTLAGRTLRLGGPAELTSTRVLPALADTVAAGVAVRARLGLADDLAGDLAAGMLDLVVSTVRPRRPGLHVEPLCDEEFVLVASPALLARLDPDLLADRPARALAGLPLLAYAEDLPVVRRWWRHVLGTAPPHRAALVVADLRGLRAAAVAGAGTTVLPRYLCADDLATGRLLTPVATDDPPINTLYLATRTATRQEPHIAHAWAALHHHARRW